MAAHASTYTKPIVVPDDTPPASPAPTVPRLDTLRLGPTKLSAKLVKAGTIT